MQTKRSSLGPPTPAAGVTDYFLLSGWKKITNQQPVKFDWNENTQVKMEPATGANTSLNHNVGALKGRFIKMTKDLVFFSSSRIYCSRGASFGLVHSGLSPP